MSNGDGSGGNAPEIEHYLVIDSNDYPPHYLGFVSHGQHGLETQVNINSIMEEKKARFREITNLKAGS